ncbi:MAG: FMN-binding negative transcriptional regulator [Giesbergeria sp.]
MYQPPQLRSTDPAHARALMRAHPLASLVSTDDAGFPVVSHLPLQLREQDGAQVLLGHCARANPHWRYLEARPQALVTFLGPQAYLSPAVYPDLARVPSWNYLAVHCRVEATLVDDAQGKDALLKALIGQHEPPYAAQWRALPEDYTGKMLKAIVGFELRVTELQCTLKLNQHRPESHAALYARYRAGDADAQALAQWMETLGLVPVGEV